MLAQSRKGLAVGYKQKEKDLVQKVLADPSATEGVANVDMMPYYLNAEDSAKNDEQIYNTIKEIADSLQQ